MWLSNSIIFSYENDGLLGNVSVDDQKFWDVMFTHGVLDDSSDMLEVAVFDVNALDTSENIADCTFGAGVNALAGTVFR